MDLLIILIYVALAYGAFKLFRIPVNKWTVPTAALIGVFIVSALVLGMNYNHPYTTKAQQAMVTIPIVPQVSGEVIEVDVTNNALVKKDTVLFRLDPTRYQAQVDKIRADLVTEQHQLQVLQSQLQEAEADITLRDGERARREMDYQRYLKGSQGRINPFSEQDIAHARQDLLSAKADVSMAMARRAALQSEVNSKINGESSVLLALKAKLKEAEYNLDKSVVRAPSDGYVTQLIVQPGTTAVTLPLRPVMVFVPSQTEKIVAAFRQNSLLRLKVGDEAEMVFNGLPGSVFSGTVSSVWPMVPNGSYQAQGVLQGLNMDPSLDEVYVTIDMHDTAALRTLPDGATAQVAIYTDHFHHLSVMRKVLLRMTSWLHYLYLDH